MSRERPRVLALGIGAPAALAFVLVLWAHLTTRYFQSQLGRINIGDHTVYSAIAVDWPAILFEFAVLLNTVACTVWAIRVKRYAAVFMVILGAGIVGFVGLFFLVDVAFWAYD